MAQNPENPGVSQLSRLGELLNTLRKCTPPGGPPGGGPGGTPPQGGGYGRGVPPGREGDTGGIPPDPTGIYHTDR